MNCSTKMLLAAGVGFLAMPQVALAQDQQSNETQATPNGGSLRLNTGISYSSGEYGELEDTEVIAGPVSLTYKQDNFKFRISVPWVMIDGPGSLLATPEGATPSLATAAVVRVAAGAAVVAATATIQAPAPATADRVRATPDRVRAVTTSRSRTKTNCSTMMASPMTMASQRSTTTAAGSATSTSRRSIPSSLEAAPISSRRSR